MYPWGNICRICASPADYEVFAKIPIYVHEDHEAEAGDWQRPINEYIEETTGLKLSVDDGLPRNICALCISYLKHAVTFREQAVNTSLNFLVVKEYKNAFNDKKECNNEKLIDNNTTSAQRNHDDDNLKNNQTNQQNKVSKILMSNTNLISTPSLSIQVQHSLKYLSGLYDKNVNSQTNVSNLEKRANGTYKSTGAKQRRHYNKTFDVTKPSAIGCNSQRYTTMEDDLPRTTSSDEYETTEEAGTRSFKNNIFSYKEKNFEEDDIMDLDELKDVISINIPSTWKEKKCAYCFKRFMFEETFSNHIKTCIEYKFSTFVEEINNLIEIRRAKQVSPHEFIRRMIFTLRKTCEWLKENCVDTSLPDLLQNNQTTDSILGNQRLESECKSTISSTDEQLAQKLEQIKFNKPLSTASPLTAARPAVERITPINISNNILYEIERTESRNSQKLKLKKPIPILATANAIKIVGNLQNENAISTASQDLNLLPFTEKSCQTMADKANDLTAIKPAEPLATNIPHTPLINVRRDLLPASTTTTTTHSTQSTFNHTSPLLNLLQSPYGHNPTTCARCPQCNLYFRTLDALEIHNALQHNSLANIAHAAATAQTADELDSEHQRIIALFENDDDI